MRHAVPAVPMVEDTEPSGDGSGRETTCQPPEFHHLPAIHHVPARQTATAGPPVRWQGATEFTSARPWELLEAPAFPRPPDTALPPASEANSSQDRLCSLSGGGSVPLLSWLGGVFLSSSATGRTLPLPDAEEPSRSPWWEEQQRLTLSSSCPPPCQLGMKWSRW